MNRIQITAASAVVAAVCSVMLGSPARADDESYLNNLEGRGFQIMWQSRPFLLAAGNRICDDLRNGTSLTDEAANFQYPSASRRNIADLVAAAHADLCPEVKAAP
ncbi:DUF732 domain-containing protein [Mycobacteroides chelonae]|uniref:DUF732 domain-containing protein n=1 Tax=Mycobacteroides chelonae TaxID=1774 RepID=UPI002231CA43|nr:DUF732 domain-containing protein [Mycobacteroides chelonae]